MDETWNFVGSKKHQRWLWHAMDHNTHEVLAYHFGSRKDQAFLSLKKKLLSCSIGDYCIDGWRAHQCHLTSQKHFISRKNTQAIERKHLTLRTRIKRLARTTICFSKLEQMHDTVIGLFINRFEFGKVL